MWRSRDEPNCSIKENKMATRKKAATKAGAKKATAAKRAGKATAKATISKKAARKSGHTTTKAPATKTARPAVEKLQALTPAGRKESFFELVFEVARQIPRGRVTSYGAIAASLGARSSSRMVGWAMNGAGRVRPVVPAHRVVNRNGMLSGKHHFATPTRMKELLEKEGIQVKNDTVVKFKELFWDPAEDLF